MVEGDGGRYVGSTDSLARSYCGSKDRGDFRKGDLFQEREKGAPRTTIHTLAADYRALLVRH